MKLKSFFFVSIILIPSILIGCQPRKNKNTGELKVETGKGGGADVNDVSILFPLPDKPEDIQKLFPINFVNAAGQSPISQELFQSLINHHDYEVEVDGKKEKRFSGASFTGKKRLGKVVDLGPYDQISDWKIIAMRFDPCAPLPTSNLLGHGRREVRSSFDPKSCLLQLRLTAQPILPKGRERRLGSGPVLAADYALHLLFSLDMDQAKQLYGELLKFKAMCGDLTSSLPLTIHPCLLKENNEKGINGPHHAEVQRLIKSYAKKLVAIAMIATVGGDDPWTFMNGLVESGKFIHLPINAVRKDDPTTFTTGQKGNTLEPFSNGFYQQLNFLALAEPSPDRRTQPTDTNPKAVRVSPVPIASKVNVSLLDEYNLAFNYSDFDAKGPTEKTDKMLKKVLAIENPLLNDFFSTDCASCHASANVSGAIRGATMAYGRYDPRWGGTDGGAAASIASIKKYQMDIIPGSRADFDRFISVMSRQSYAEMFRIQGPYTQVADPNLRARSDSGGHPTILMQFAYLGSKAIISQRTINESILVAKMANSFFGQGREAPVRCDQEKFAACMQSPDILYPSSDELEFAIPICLIQVCPARIAEMKAVFGDRFPKAYRVKKAFNSTGASYLYAQVLPADILDFPVGMVVYGTFEAPRTDDLQFRPSFAQEFKTVGGTKLLINRRFSIVKGNNWADWFEEIDPGEVH